MTTTSQAPAAEERARDLLPQAWIEEPDAWYPQVVEGVFALLADRDAQAAQIEQLRVALGELVSCKRLKDSIDAGPVSTDDLIEYQRRKPAAWAAAFAIVDALAAPAPQEPKTP